MTQDKLLDLIRDALMTIIICSAPPLAIGLTVGVIVSIFQAVTSIQEPTLAFIPKILAVLLSLIFFGPFMLSTLTGFFQALLNSIPELMVPR